MSGKRAVLAVVAGSPMSPNMEAVLHNLGRMVSDTFELHLMAVEPDISDRLRAYYTTYGVAAYRIDPGRFRYAHRGCGQYLRHQRPDILINVAQSSLALAVAWWGRRVNVPTVARVTGDPLEAGLGRSSWERLKSRVIHGRIMLAACRRATRVLTLGSRVRGKLMDLGIPADKISALPQPFDPDPFRPSEGTEQAKRKQALGLRHDRRTLLFVGRLSWLKGADRLLEIVRQIQDNELAFQLCLIGRGEYEHWFQEYPDDLVHMVGKVSHEQIAAYYHAADVMVFPSRTEGLPNVILEAMAARLPIIASPVGEIPDYVSRTATQPSEYVAWLKGGDWTPDPLPDWFSWEIQRSAYIDLFSRVIREYRQSTT